MAKAKQHIFVRSFGIFGGFVQGVVCPQAARVLEMMLKNGYITRLTAMHNGVANVTARIAELRSAGVDVRCDERQDELGRRYGRWFVPGSAQIKIVREEA